MEAAYGAEMAYMRDVASDAFRYATAIQEAAGAGANQVEYPGDNYLAWNLAIVARLIKGGLGARIYHVSIDGFDTTPSNPIGTASCCAVSPRPSSPSSKIWLSAAGTTGCWR